MAEALEFQWQKDDQGYCFDETPPHLEGKVFPVGKRIVRKGGRLISTSPLRNDRLFAVFSDVMSDEELLQFVATHGSLTLGGLRNDEPEVAITLIRIGQNDAVDEPLPVEIHHKGDDVQLMLHEASWFRQAIKYHQTNYPGLADFLNAGIQDIQAEVCVRAEPDGLRFKIRPACLLDAMKLQLAHSLSAIEWRTCDHCGQLFEIGSRTGRAKYRTAKYCSTRCRIAAHRQKVGTRF